MKEKEIEFDDYEDEIKKLPDDDYDGDEDDFQCCSDCDLPDACSDFGCAVEQGLQRRNDGVF